MSKAKRIAISAMCCAVASVCMFLSGLPGLKWIVLVLGVVSSVAVVIPLMLDTKNLVYTLLTYIVSSILGVFLGLANIVYVLPIVVFCMPVAIVKVCGEMVKITATVKDTQVMEDPFGNGDDRKVVNLNVERKPRLPKVVKWVLYYVLLEVGIALTLLACYLFTPAVFNTIVQSKWFAIVLVAAQFAVVAYDFLLRGALIAVAKILRFAVKP